MAAPIAAATGSVGPLVSEAVADEVGKGVQADGKDPVKPEEKEDKKDTKKAGAEASEAAQKTFGAMAESMDKISADAKKQLSDSVAASQSNQKNIQDQVQGKSSTTDNK